jgi:hypothetical protein
MIQLNLKVKLKESLVQVMMLEEMKVYLSWSQRLRKFWKSRSIKLKYEQDWF